MKEKQVVNLSFTTCFFLIVRWVFCGDYTFGTLERYFSISASLSE